MTKTKMAKSKMAESKLAESKMEDSKMTNFFNLEWQIKFDINLNLKELSF